MKLLAIMFALFSTNIWANSYSDGESDWMRISKTMGSIQINIDYKISCHTYSLGTVCTANPIWFNVYGANPESMVRVVMMNNCANNNKELQQVDLKYDGSNKRFTGDIPYGLKQMVNNCQQEFAMVVDGVWSSTYNQGKNYPINLMR